MKAVDLKLCFEGGTLGWSKKGITQVWMSYTKRFICKLHIIDWVGFQSCSTNQRYNCSYHKKISRIHFKWVTFEIDADMTYFLILKNHS